MHGLTSGQSSRRGFVRSALVLTACTAVVGLCLLPYAARHAGSAGPLGLAVAGAICLVGGWSSEAFAVVFARAGTPLVGLLTSMSARLAPPLIVCLALAAQGGDGRRHLAFVGYLLTFYLATLALETWLAVKRVSETATDIHPPRP